MAQPDSGAPAADSAARVPSRRLERTGLTKPSLPAIACAAALLCLLAAPAWAYYAPQEKTAYITSYVPYTRCRCDLQLGRMGRSGRSLRPHRVERPDPVR